MTKQSILVDTSNGGCYGAEAHGNRGIGDTFTFHKKNKHNTIINGKADSVDSVLSSSNNTKQHQQRGLDLPIQNVIKIEQEDITDFSKKELSTTEGSSPLARCMTKEEIELLSKNSESSLEKELIEYLKMQQQQQHFQQQQQHHPQQQSFESNNSNHELKHHLNNSIIQNNQHPLMPIMNQRKSPAQSALHPQLNVSKQSIQHQQSNYQNLCNTPTAQNLSSPTEIANYMSGQNPMDSLNNHHHHHQHHHNHHNHSHFPLPISEIKKEVDYDHNGGYTII